MTLSKSEAAPVSHKLPDKLPDLLKQQYDRYMSRADDAETCARVCADPQERQSWERVAEGWRELAAKLLRGSRL